MGGSLPRRYPSAEEVAALRARHPGGAASSHRASNKTDSRPRKTWSFGCSRIHAGFCRSCPSGCGGGGPSASSLGLGDHSMVAVALCSSHTTHRRSQRGSCPVLLEALVAPRRSTLALLRAPRHPTGIPPCLPRKRADSWEQVATDEPRREAVGRGAERAPQSSRSTALPWRGSGSLGSVGGRLLPQAGRPVRCPDPDTLPQSSYLDAAVPSPAIWTRLFPVQLSGRGCSQSSYLDAAVRHFFEFV